VLTGQSIFGHYKKSGCESIADKGPGVYRTGLDGYVQQHKALPRAS
jgi:hypothetical protein